MIDRYDLTGNNCTTTSLDALKLAGTQVFAGKSILGSEYTEDFTILSSLERYLSNLSSSAEMGVVEVTRDLREASSFRSGRMSTIDDFIDFDADKWGYRHNNI